MKNEDSTILYTGGLVQRVICPYQREGFVADDMQPIDASEFIPGGSMLSPRLHQTHENAQMRPDIRR